MAEGVGPGFWQGQALFCALAAARRCEESLFAPDRPAHRGQGIAEGGVWLGVPGGRGDALALADRETVRQQADNREQREQAGRCAGNCLVGSLPLGLDAQMRPRVLEGDLDLPALDEPADDLRRIAQGVGA